MTILELPPHPTRSPKPELGEDKAWLEQGALYFFVLLPFVAFLAVVPVVWGWGMSWADVFLSVGWYFATLLGVTVGFHRYFTHAAFRARRGLRIGLAIAGSFAVEGPPIMWVADHRRHHAFSDQEGDPHSPWRFGTSLRSLMKGIWFAHVGWLFTMEQTNQERYTPDLLRDRDIVAVDKLFPLWTVLTLTLPGVMGGLIAMSWSGVLSGFFWAGLVRVFLLHHVTWSINSICHVVGQRPFSARDRSANFWPLAILSAGESWHNLHHADPTAARHGVLRGQVDISARVIWFFEKLGWVSEARWPSRARIDKLRQGR